MRRTDLAVIKAPTAKLPESEDGKSPSQDISPLVIGKKQLSHAEIESVQLRLSTDQASMNRRIVTLYENVLSGKHDLSSELYLRMVNLGITGVHQLAFIMPFYIHITCVKLWKTKIGAEGMSILAKELVTLKGLEVLALEDNGIGASGCSALAKILSSFKRLRELWVPVNDIHIEGAKALSGALSNLTTLEKVNFDENAMENEGAKAILTALARLPSIMMVSIAYNHITSAGTETILSFIHSSHSLEKINLTGNLFQEKDRNTLSAAIAEGKVHIK